jgi:hypothetical protein
LFSLYLKIIFNLKLNIIYKLTEIPEKLLVNLSILAKIQKNGRIKRSSDGIVSLDEENFQSILRFINSDSRKQSVFEINSIISDTSDKVKEIINNKFMNQNCATTDEYYSNCELLLLLNKSLASAKEGILNLKFTYTNDHNTVSQLDIIILKINNILKESMYKFNYFNQMLPSNVRIFTESQLDFNSSNYTLPPNEKDPKEFIINMQSML